MLKYDDFMKLALNEAKKCSRKKEIPVGAIIVDEFKNIISKGYNKVEEKNNPLFHAEKIAIDKGLWSKEELKRQKNLLRSYDLPTEIPKINKEDVLTILMGDKKVRNGKMRFILPKEIGAVDIYDDVEDSLFLKFFS